MEELKKVESVKSELVSALREAQKTEINPITKAYLAESYEELYNRLGLIDTLRKVKWLRMKEVLFPKFQSDSQAVFLVRSMVRGFKNQPAEILAKSSNAYQKDSVPFIQVVSTKGIEHTIRAYENDAYLDAILLYAPKETIKKGTHGKLL